MKIGVLIAVFLFSLGISFLNKKNEEKAKSNKDKIQNRINNRKVENEINKESKEYKP